MNEIIKSFDEINKQNKNKREKLKSLIEQIKLEKEQLKINTNIFLNQRKMSFENQKKQLEVEAKGNKMDITKICYTGGPCAGKTTSIIKVADQLREKGYTVFIVPEAASMIFSAGGNLNMAKYTDLQAIYFQYYLMMLQISMEDIYTGLAAINSNDKIVILCDRGIMDGKAYMTKAQWKLLENEFGLRTEKMRDDRYDLIVHLVTAARGTPKHYDLHSNPARFESIKFAQELDEKLQNSWTKHPNYMMVDNLTGDSFEDKLTTVSQIIFKELGNPQNLKFYNKYMLKNKEKEFSKMIKNELNVNIYKFELEDVIFFKEKNEVVYYRKRKQKNGIATFIKCLKRITNGKYYENRRQTSYREFLSMKNLQTKDSKLSRKTRYLWFLTNVRNIRI